MMVHHFQVRVMYSYILVGPVFGTFKVFSDVFILWGVWRVLIRYKHLRPTMEETDSLFLTVTAGGLLWVLAFYQYCLLFALSFAWLSFSDLGVINAIAKGRSSFDVAFTAVQFCSTIGTVLWAALCAEKSSLGWRTEEGGRPDYEVRAYSSEYLRRRPNTSYRRRNISWPVHLFVYFCGHFARSSLWANWIDGPLVFKGLQEQEMSLMASSACSFVSWLCSQSQRKVLIRIGLFKGMRLPCEKLTYGLKVILSK